MAYCFFTCFCTESEFIKLSVVEIAACTCVRLIPICLLANQCVFRERTDSNQFSWGQGTGEKRGRKGEELENIQLKAKDVSPKYRCN